MIFNGEVINGVAINAQVPGGAFPINTIFRAELKPKTDFTSFSSFKCPPFALIGFDQPADTDMRFAFRFVNGGTILVYTGTDWQALTGDEITNGMTSTDLTNLDASDMLATGGFDTGTPFLQIIVYMRTTDGAKTPAISGINVTYLQGSVVQIVWSNTLLNDVPVESTTNTIPAGTYLWDTSNGYRLDDGVSDDGRAITFSFTSQEGKYPQGDGFVESRYDMISVHLRTLTATTLKVTPITDGVVGATVTENLTTTKYEYDIPVPVNTRGMAHQYKLEWTDKDVLIKSSRMVLEAETDSVLMP